MRDCNTLIVSGRRGLFVLLKSSFGPIHFIIHMFAQALGYYVYESRRAVNDKSRLCWYVLKKCSHLGSHWGEIRSEIHEELLTWPVGHTNQGLELACLAVSSVCCAASTPVRVS